MNDDDLSNYQPHHRGYIGQIDYQIGVLHAVEQEYRATMAEFMLMPQTKATASDVEAAAHAWNAQFKVIKGLLSFPPTNFDHESGMIANLMKKLDEGHDTFKQSLLPFRAKIASLDSRTPDGPEWMSVHEGIGGHDFISRMMKASLDDEPKVVPAVQPAAPKPSPIAPSAMPDRQETVTHPLPISPAEMQARLRNAGVEIVPMPARRDGSDAGWCAQHAVPSVAAMPAMTVNMVAAEPMIVDVVEAHSGQGENVLFMGLGLLSAVVMGLWKASCFFADPLVALGEWLSETGRFTPGKAGFYLGLRYGSDSRTARRASSAMGVTMLVSSMLGAVLSQRWIVVPALMGFFVYTVFYAIPASGLHALLGLMAH